MSHIIDDAKNVQQFTAVTTNVLASFGQNKNYGRPSRSELPSPAHSVVQSQPSASTTMDLRTHALESPSTPPPLDNASTILPSCNITQEISQITTGPTPPPSHNDPKLGWNEDCFKSINDGPSEKTEVVFNKHLDSPQLTGFRDPPTGLRDPLTGLRAPPSTPETWAHKIPPTVPLYRNRQGGDPLEEELSKEDFLISHIEKHMANKPVHIGLSESMYAPRLSSPLANEGYHTQYRNPERNVSPNSRRDRENSFERLSFVVASASKAELLSKINRDIMTEPDFLSQNLIVPLSQTPKENEDATVRPPQLRVTAPSPVRVQPSKTLQAKMKSENIAVASAPSPIPDDVKGKQAHTKLENSAVAPPIDGMKAGLQSSRDKYSARTKAPASKADPAPFKNAIVPVAKHVAFSELTESPASAQKVEPPIETPSRLKWISAVASDAVETQENKPVAKSNPAIIAQACLPRDLMPSCKALDDVKNQKSVADTVIASDHRPSTPLRFIAVSPRDVPLSGKDDILKTPCTPLGNITPVSVKFEKLSPRTTRSVLRPNAPKSFAGKADDQDNTHKTHFGRYPMPERRDTPAAGIRRAIISGLPIPSSTKFVASLVYGGLVESIVMKPGGTAEVLFVVPDECSQFCNDNSNGLVYGKEEYENRKTKELFVFVKPHVDVDVVGGQLKEAILQGVTRCVRVIWADTAYTKHDLWKLAENKTRKVEHIVDELKPVEITSSGHTVTKECRTIIFRFCKIQDANSFCASLRKDVNWEHCNIRFDPDPCATATGVHLDN